MKFDGYQIKACPNCSQLYKDRIVVSFNTFGARNFSDGYVEGDWIPRFTNIIKCVNKDCGKFFKLADQKLITEIAFEDREDPEWVQAFNTSDCVLGIIELEKALTTEFCNERENEIMIRTLLNRKYNHTLKEEIKKEMPEAERKSQIKTLVA